MNTHKGSFIPFKEVQNFPRSWIAIGILLIALVFLWLFPVHSAWDSLVLWDGTTLFMLGCFYAFFTILLLPLIIAMLYGRMTTEVNRDGLYIRHFPFRLPLRLPFHKKISLDSLALIEITTYETSRWSGYPITYVAGDEQFAGNLYDTNQFSWIKCSGMGVRLKFFESDSFVFMVQNFPKDVLIASQRPKELAQAIQQLAPHCKIVQTGHEK